MPIVFIVSGIFFIVLIFGYGEIKKLSYRYLLIVGLLCVMLGYFFRDVSFGSLYIDLFSLIAFLIAIVLLINNSSFYLSTIVLSVLLSFVFKFFLDLNINMLISLNNDFAISFIMFCSIPFLLNFKKGVLFVLVESFLLLVYCSRIDVMNTAVSVFDFNFCFEVLLCYVLIYVIVNMLDLWIKYYLYGRNYAKRGCSNFFINGFLNF